LETAKECSVAAENNAWIQWEAGYDFGYQSPGYIHAHSDVTSDSLLSSSQTTSIAFSLKTNHMLI
jgi:hypothetical protein